MLIMTTERWLDIDAGVEKTIALIDEQRALITAGSGCSRVYGPDSAPRSTHAPTQRLLDVACRSDVVSSLVASPKRS